MTDGEVTLIARPGQYKILLRNDHLTSFRSSIPKGAVDDPGSRNTPSRWAACTGLSDLPNVQVNRKDIVELFADASVPIEVVCWSILTWGGMHGRHRDSLNRQPDRHWLTLARDIRAGQYNRSQAYEKFLDLKGEGKLIGMGPAYWTKLIFFLMPRGVTSKPIGYIMDQWVGCAINLLAGHQVVLMNYTLTWRRSKKGTFAAVDFVVSELNPSERYEKYCQFVEEIAAQISRSPDETELLLMSDGGRNKQLWRNYIIEHRQPP